MSDLLKADIPNALLVTYSGYAYFSWPATLVGKVITMEWDYMTTAQYDSLYTKYTNDAIVIFNPRQDASFRFNVIIKSLIGKYFLNMSDSNSFRKDVKMELILVSTV
jgi:hypothetical protein